MQKSIWVATTIVVCSWLGCSDDEVSNRDAGTSSTGGATTTSGTTGTTAAGDTTTTGTTGGSAAPSTFRGEVWADNWSAAYVGHTQVMEDSVPITTERSFNQETFEFEATRPFLLNVIMKDYIADDSGLEYIGQPNQQMGDGGYIAQFTEVASGEIVAVSNAEWTCLTIHTAPLDKSCEKSDDPLTDCTWETAEEPAGWMAEDFDDSSWPPATVYTAAEVSPKQGYDEIDWDPSAELIWGADLEQHNTILCRVWVD